MDKKTLSYTAASNEFPLKILLNKEIMEALNEKEIIPFHVQFNFTNRCPLSCEWCSCSNREKDKEMPLERVKEIITTFKKLGMKSSTLTGGGETLAHQNINEIISFLNFNDIKIGVVTNGVLIKRLSGRSLGSIIWMRISLGDGRICNDNYWRSIEDVVSKGRKIDFSFSYVVTSDPDFKLIREVIEFANRNNFTHIRIVNDILNADTIDIEPVKKFLKESNIDDKLVIYQDRRSWSKGREKCWISLLKPVVDVDGYLLPCCGTQYALDKPSRDYERLMRMGKVEDIEMIIEQKRCFNGKNCVKCYYDNYNQLLDLLLEDIKHKEFI